MAQRAKAKQFDQVEAVIKKYLFYQGKNAEPWMYEILVKAIEARKPHTEEEVSTCLSYAAKLAKRSKNPEDLIRVADMLVVRNLYQKVGTAGAETDVAELLDLAAEKAPMNAFPPMMSINLATKLKDPRRMGDSTDALLSLGWPGYDDKLRRDSRVQVQNLIKVLREDGKTADAEALDARYVASEARDVYARLTWATNADIDLIVGEPLGATAEFKTPRTVFGGAIIKNGFGSHPEEVYVCPRAFDGDYTFRIEPIFNDPNKPAVEATLAVILHEGAEGETRIDHRFDLSKPDTLTVKLMGGRRKVVLPFIAPPTRPPGVKLVGERDRPTAPVKPDASKEAPTPPVGRVAPIR